MIPMHDKSNNQKKNFLELGFFSKFMEKVTSLQQGHGQ